MHRVVVDEASGLVVDEARAHSLVRRDEGPTWLWSFEDDTRTPVTGLLEPAGHFSLSPDARWLLALTEDRTRRADRLLHLPSGASRSLASLSPMAVVTDGGWVADTDGEQIRVWESPVPTEWALLRPWIEVVTTVPPVSAAPWGE